jgi:hypothetical protein
MLAEDDLEDDSLDPPNISTRDLNRQVRKLAAAVLVQAVKQGGMNHCSVSDVLLSPYGHRLPRSL